MRTLILIPVMTLALAAIGCNGGQERNPDPTTPRSDPTAARALFDEAIVAGLSGDGIAQQDLRMQLVTEHPDTPHGRAARARLGGDGMISIATIGILAAVAIPAFMKYTRRSKTSEATMNIRRLFDSAVSYYVMSSYAPDGTPRPGHFPPSAPLTPDAPHCGRDGEQYLPRPDDWSHPTWQALNFAINEPHYYRYEFISTGEGPSAMFTARALGDLNCDGVLATFERIGTIDEEGNVTGGAGMYQANELE